MRVALLGYVLVVTVFLSGETMAVSRHVPPHETTDDHASDPYHSTHHSLGHRSSPSYYSSGHHSGEQATSRVVARRQSFFGNAFRKIKHFVRSPGVQTALRIGSKAAQFIVRRRLADDEETTKLNKV
ncbi:hypothetical protein LEN26_011979 [Aphanomyces euteiches]|nr:hypothetical protein AeMF1_013486 [Aphanomyces euteiches]KAH9118675.1 hypothetical protein LEN26_011979 [Aphanomyces euteiches]KAH9185586.1 hypothetical protein AeNC1_012438 [Aphanomyces euteiches]